MKICLPKLISGVFGFASWVCPAPSAGLGEVTQSRCRWKGQRSAAKREPSWAWWLLGCGEFQHTNMRSNMNSTSSWCYNVKSPLLCFGFGICQVVSYILQGRLEEARQMLMKQAVLHPAARNMYKLMDSLLGRMPFYNVWFSTFICPFFTADNICLWSWICWLVQR